LDLNVNLWTSNLCVRLGQISRQIRLDVERVSYSTTARGTFGQTSPSVSGKTIKTR
jgi:hypothetical protein